MIIIGTQNSASCIAITCQEGVACGQYLHMKQCLFSISCMAVLYEVVIPSSISHRESWLVVNTYAQDSDL